MTAMADGAITIAVSTPEDAATVLIRRSSESARRGQQTRGSAPVTASSPAR